MPVTVASNGAITIVKSGRQDAIYAWGNLASSSAQTCADVPRWHIVGGRAVPHGQSAAAREVRGHINAGASGRTNAMRASAAAGVALGRGRSSRAAVQAMLSRGRGRGRGRGARGGRG